jgi:hypothetical protein
MAKANGTENYQDRIIFRIHQLIHSMVGVHQDYPDGFKSLKQNLPTIYSGNSNLNAFDSWLRELLRYFQLAQMAAPSGITFGLQSLVKSSKTLLRDGM